MPRLYVGIVIEKAVAGLRLPTVWGSFVGLKPSLGEESARQGIVSDPKAMTTGSELLKQQASQRRRRGRYVAQGVSPG